MVLLAWIFSLPFHEIITLNVSFPLRMVATVIAVTLMRLFGMTIVNDQTTISIGEHCDIAITDPCSGIEGMMALLLIGWFLARTRQTFFWSAVVHYLFVVPAIIFANSLRIIITAVGYRIIGQTILCNSVHSFLGYVQLALAFAIFHFAGVLITHLAEDP